MEDQQEPSRTWREAHKGYDPVPPLHGAPQTAADQKQRVDTELAAKHEESKRKYPELSLSHNEYVIEAVRRHPIGLLSIWLLVGFLCLVVLGLLPLYAANQGVVERALDMSLPSAAILAAPVLILTAFFVLGGFIATVVYQGNRFYLTNESVIQHVRHSLFHTKTQIINLVNVEDASYDKKGIIQQLLGYGTLRLSTQGEETIYHFYFVANPHRVVNSVNEAVEVAMQNLEGNLRAHQVRE